MPTLTEHTGTATSTSTLSSTATPTFCYQEDSGGPVHCVTLTGAPPTPTATRGGKDHWKDKGWRDHYDMNEDSKYHEQDKNWRNHHEKDKGWRHHHDKDEHWKDDKHIQWKDHEYSGVEKDRHWKDHGDWEHDDHRDEWSNEDQWNDDDDCDYDGKKQDDDVKKHSWKDGKKKIWDRWKDGHKGWDKWQGGKKHHHATEAKDGA
ncbi:hypothetical protein BJV82DRAFT_613716 [Fennellomyces sp. T-0311]|nr:hypothetical protein BJV82DRAFT_613716 [Fennellomyces sp. T-0311]